MPIKQLQGLKGLPGLNSLSKYDRDAFLFKYKDKLAPYSNTSLYDKMANALYDNRQFIARFGQEAFDKLNDDSWESLEQRNAILRHSVIEENWNKYRDEQNFGKSTTDAIAGISYRDLDGMTDDGKLKLMQSKWLNPKEFDINWEKRYHERTDVDLTSVSSILGHFGSTWTSAMAMRSASNTGEADRQIAIETNSNILKKIFNEDINKQAKSSEIKEAEKAIYYSDDMINLGDENVEDTFKKMITPNSYDGNAGIPAFAAYYGIGTDEGISAELQNLSIDDKRKIIAKKLAYDKMMSPSLAAIAINNYAKDYIREHQNIIQRNFLYAKDYMIGTLSYGADKTNALLSLGLDGIDLVFDKPKVWVDNKGEILDPNFVSALKPNKDGSVSYKTPEGETRTAYKREVNRSTLHSMGKNFDGSENEGLLNPKYWSRAEMFGTLDSDLQKQYEKLGASPYSQAYGSEEGTSILHEVSKMTLFGLEDTVESLLPTSIAKVGTKLSELAHAAKAVQQIGKAMRWAGNLANTTKGQFLKGLQGAGGISYAYSRGTFDETLQKNMGTLEERTAYDAKQAIYDKYNNDEQYKSYVDRLISAEANSLKKQKLQQMQGEGDMQVADPQAFDTQIENEAQYMVVNKLVEDEIAKIKSTKEYSDKVQKGIAEAGYTARSVFWQEGVKYSLINTLGFRKFIYKNPTGLENALDKGLEGLKEITTKEGAKRLVVEGLENVKSVDKWKKFGAITAKQAWGGGWTNGTDDMQVDGAEKVNEDAYNMYLDNYSKAKAAADTYGFTDWVQSTINGLENSMGQATTARAFGIGLAGSTFAGQLHIANIASLMTKSGREAFKRNFQERVLRDADGIALKNEDGTFKTEKVGWKENWRDRLGFLVQNGVLNEYYGAKQNLRNLQEQADFINNMLDSYDDFKSIEELVAATNGEDNATNFKDKKTAARIRAIQALSALNRLGNNKNDPATMSSVVQNAKEFIRKAALLNTEEGQDKDNSFSEEEIKKILSEWYANNPGVPQTQFSAEVALDNIQKRAAELQEASKDYDNAEEILAKAEKNNNMSFDPDVRQHLKLILTLNPHWQKRIASMKEEIGDESENTETPTGDLLFSVLGGKTGATRSKVAFSNTIAELEKLRDKAREKRIDAYENLNDRRDRRNKGSKFQIDIDFEYKREMRKLEAAYNDAQQVEQYYENLISIAKEKLKNVEDALNDATPSAEYKGTFVVGPIREARVLTAEEIMQLDPVSRARMLDEANKDDYSETQQREIEKLKTQLKVKDPGALQKIQDIATLTRNIKSAEDAYSRIIDSPEAAAHHLEEQRELVIREAANMIIANQAVHIANVIDTDFKQGLEEIVGKPFDEIDSNIVNAALTRALRGVDNHVLSLIQDNHLLPEYDEIIEEAKNINDLLDDIAAVVNNASENATWKENILNNIEELTEKCSSYNEIMDVLKKVVEDTNSNDFKLVLQGLADIGNISASTIVEGIKAKEQREAKENKQKEEREKKEKAEKQEREKKAAEAKKAAEEAANKPKDPKDPNNNPDDAPPIDDRSNNNDNNGEGNNNGGEGNNNKGNSNSPKTPPTGNGDGGNNNNPSTPSEPNNDDGGNKGNNGNSNTGTGENSSSKPINKEDDKNTPAENNNNSNTPPKGNNNSPAENNTAENNKSDDKGENAPKEPKGEGNDNSNTSNEHSNEPSNNGENKETGNDGKNIPESNSQDTLPEKSEEEPHSPTIEEQAKNTTDTTIVTRLDEDNLNKGNKKSDGTVESGNGMSEFVSSKLEEGVLEHKVGDAPNDVMNRWYAWEKAMGLKLQDIIDYELGKIIANNPQAKFKYMAINGNYNATKDNTVKERLCLVLDYDDTINKGITSIHDESRGGIIDSNGKKYLIVGVVGYERGNKEKEALHMNLWFNDSHSRARCGLFRQEKGIYFEQHPNERFYVSERYASEMNPNSLISGYLIRRTEKDAKDEEIPHKSVVELMNDEESNPHHITLDNAIWGIQELQTFLVVGTNGTTIPLMPPRNVYRNLGSAFIIVPASNGKYVPIHLDVCKYTEMSNGALKEEIDALLYNVMSPNYNTRKDAIIKLMTDYFYMNSEGDYIVTTKDGALSLIKDGQKFATFYIGENFDTAGFMEGIQTMNPRLNITAKVLKNKETLQKFAEAGALNTDVRILGTRGSSYEIIGLDSNGNMIPRPTPPNNSNTPTHDSEYRNLNRQQVILNHKYYTFEHDKYYLNGIPVIDDATITQLDYNRQIIERELVPSSQDHEYQFYILDSGENAKVIKVNRNTKKVEVFSKEESKKYIEDKLAKDAAEGRTENSESIIKELDGAEDVDLNTSDLATNEELNLKLGFEPSENKEDKEGEGSPELDLFTGDSNTQNQGENKGEMDKEGTIPKPTIKDISLPGENKSTQSFETLYAKSKWRLKIKNIVAAKWKDAPSDKQKLKEFLREKHIDVDTISTTEDGIEAWIKTIEECRQ